MAIRVEQYRGYNLMQRDADDDQVTIYWGATPLTTVADMATAERVVDEYHNAP